jgi:Chaperone for flagella basal body P-ring formation
MIILFFWAFSGCQSVHGERITAGDLAAAVPAFAELPPETPLGYAPMPGASRNLTGREIQRMASQAGISTPFSDSICVEWPMRKLGREDLLDAMRTSLHNSAADVRVEEFSMYLVPEGKVEFPMTGLSHPPSGPAFWRGYVAYSGSKRFDIWAKVRVPESLIDVRVGDTVQVVVESSFARLKLDGRAESSGMAGEKITVRNPRSGKTFAAEITGSKSVRVMAGEPGQGEANQ